MTSNFLDKHFFKFFNFSQLVYCFTNFTIFLIRCDSSFNRFKFSFLRCTRKNRQNKNLFSLAKHIFMLYDSNKHPQFRMPNKQLLRNKHSWMWISRILKRFTDTFYVDCVLLFLAYYFPFFFFCTKFSNAEKYKHFSIFLQLFNDMYLD